jgi:hypothetical protein
MPVLPSVFRVSAPARRMVRLRFEIKRDLALAVAARTVEPIRNYRRQETR